MQYHRSKYLYESVDPDTLKIVQNRFSFSSDPNINVISEQKQTNSYDCGLFAIANATAIVFGENPIYHHFSVHAMRDHLIKCYENKEMYPFPIGGWLLNMIITTLSLLITIINKDNIF